MRRRVAGHRLVDGVVDDLVDHVVEPGRAGGADVHAGALADGLEALEHLDRVGAVRESGSEVKTLPSGQQPLVVAAGE